MPPAFPRDPHGDGLAAQDFGLPMSDCPYELNTDDGRLWRLGWLRGEHWQRRIEGRMGEPPERWDEAQQMVDAEYLPDPCQEVIDNLEELASGDQDDELAQGGTVRTYARLPVRPAGAPADAWRGLHAVVRSVAFTTTPPSGKTDMLSAVLNDARKMMTRAAVSTHDAAAVAAAVAALVRCYSTDPPPDDAAAGYASDQLGRALPNPSPPAAKKRQPLCPSHGVELRGGGCPRCQREQQRRQNRRRR